MTRRRLSKSERKHEIQECAIQLFTEKGYKNTTMQDLASASGLSIGGLYHHYNSCSEVLYDLMLLGSKYREKKIQSLIKTSHKPFSYDFLAEVIVDKCLDDNQFMPIYVMFLQAIQEDPRLFDLYLQLKRSSIERLKEIFQGSSCQALSKNQWDLLTDYINTMILGCELIGARGIFLKNQDVIKKSVLQILILD